ncbi:MAG: c-type cytochrome [Deltaproteobacteria bacterium]|nr:c-type cytochrome [Deltaproteobacteria bacterium]
MILLPLLVLAGCDKVDEKPVPNRWFKPSQVALGQDVFRTHCEVCHGERGKGNQGWKQRLPDGSFPPPPLNGTGHTWHHRLSLLLRIIDDGGKLYSGKMPGFKGKLSKKEKIAVLAYVQSLWSPEVYSYWDKNLNGNEATR